MEKQQETMWLVLSFLAPQEEDNQDRQVFYHLYHQNGTYSLINKYFTQDVMDELNKFAATKFLYGDSGEIEEDDEDE